MTLVVSEGKYSSGVSAVSATIAEETTQQKACRSGMSS